MTIPTYIPFAVVATFINPLCGIIAIICGVKSKSKSKSGSLETARIYSDTAYGFAFVGIFLSILVVVMVYAFGYFPANTYYDRTELILRVYNSYKKD